MKLTPDQLDTLRRLVRRMSRRRRLITLLYWGERMTTREIAITLNMPPTKIRAEIRRIRRSALFQIRFTPSREQTT